MMRRVVLMSCMLVMLRGLVKVGDWFVGLVQNEKLVLFHNVFFQWLVGPFIDKILGLFQPSLAVVDQGFLVLCHGILCVRDLPRSERMEFGFLDLPH